MFDHLDSDRGIHLVGQLDLREVDHKLDLGISISKTHMRRGKKRPSLTFSECGVKEAVLLKG